MARAVTARGVAGLLTAVCIATVPSCAWLLPSEQVEAVTTARVQAFSRTIAIADSAESVFAVEVDGLTARARAWRQQRCLVESGRRVDQERLRSQRNSPWAWALWVAEAAVAGALAVATDSPWDRMGLALAVPVAVDFGILAHRAGHRVAESLPPIEQLDHSEAMACSREPLRNLAVAWRGDRGQVQTTTDSTGQTDLALSSLPRLSFPYQWPLATASCPECTPQPVAPTADFAANLVIARRDLDDFDSWLLLHPDTARAQDIHRARAQTVARLKGEQDALLQQARAARARGDWLAAAADARACELLCRLPAPACTALYGEIVDAFVLQQRTLGLQAAARGELDQVEAALYRCRLMDPQRPACRHIAEAAADLRATPLVAKGEAAAARKDFAAAHQAIAECRALSAVAPACSNLELRINAAERAWHTDQAGQLARAGAKAWSRKQRGAACLLAGRCRELDAGQAGCARLLQRCQRSNLPTVAP